MDCESPSTATATVTNFGMFVTNANGAAPLRLSRETFDSWPAWSADDRWIAFQSRRDGNDEIYKVAVP
jgi:Tol biopolymer transport system component